MWLLLAGLVAAAPAVLFGLFRVWAWWMNRRCVFCAIQDGKLTARFVEGFADDTLLAFHDIRPGGETHVLVVPRQHIRDIGQVRGVTLLRDMRAAAERVMLLLRLDPRETELVFTRPPFNTVFHLHLHVVHRPFRSISGVLRGWLGVSHYPALPIDAAIARLK